jgi:hypothetical protein
MVMIILPYFIVFMSRPQPHAYARTPTPGSADLGSFTDAFGVRSRGQTGVLVFNILDLNPNSSIVVQLIAMNVLELAMGGCALCVWLRWRVYGRLL